MLVRREEYQQVAAEHSAETAVRATLRAIAPRVDPTVAAQVLARAAAEGANTPAAVRTLDGSPNESSGKPATG